MTYDCIGRCDFVLVWLCLCCLRFSVPLGSVVCCMSLILENSWKIWKIHYIFKYFYCPILYLLLDIVPQFHSFFFFFFFWPFWPFFVGLVSWPGTEPRHWQWKHQVLITGRQGISCPTVLKFSLLCPLPPLFSPCVSLWIISNVLSSSYLVCWWFYYKNSWSLLLYFLSLTFTF